MARSAPIWFRAAAGVAAIVLAPAVLARAQAPLIPVTEDEARRHYPKGEVLYQNQWVSIDDLFRQYQVVRAEMKDLLEKAKAATDAVTEANSKVTGVRGDLRSTETPLRRQMALARGKMREANRALSARPPAKPLLKALPGKPRRSSYSDRDDYDDAVDKWERDVAGVKRDNERRAEEYKIDLEKHREAQAKANEDLAGAEAEIKDAEAQLAEVEREFEKRAAPFIEERDAANAEVTTLKHQAQVLITRAAEMENAMRAAPESLLLARGIVEWEKAFRLLEDLEKLHADTQAEIDRVRAELENQVRELGRELPADWKHPEQDRMDALKALLQKARAAGEQ